MLGILEFLLWENTPDLLKAIDDLWEHSNNDPSLIEAGGMKSHVWKIGGNWNTNDNVKVWDSKIGALMRLY